MMPMRRQILLSVAVLAVALVGWAVFLPAAQPVLAALGLAPVLKATGLTAATPAAQPQPGARAAGDAVPVIAQPFAKQARTEVLSAIGTARGIQSVALATEVTGRVTAVRAAPGDHVAKGTVLLELDSESARIVLERSRLLVADAQAKFDRLLRLQPSGAVTDQQVQDAELALKSAQLEEQSARLDLSRHSILAPVDGWIGLIPVEPGDVIAAGTPITSVEDRSALIVEFRLPERLSNLVRTGDGLSARPLTGTDSTVEGRITALDNRVDPASRSLRAEATLPNTGDLLRPGMAIALTMTITGDNLLAVDPLAIQWGADGAYVWVVRAGKAERLPVRIRQRLADLVLIDATPAPGDLVITEGVAALRPGSAVAPAASGD